MAANSTILKFILNLCKSVAYNVNKAFLTFLAFIQVLVNFPVEHKNIKIVISNHYNTHTSLFCVSFKMWCLYSFADEETNLSHITPDVLLDSILKHRESAPLFKTP